MQHSLCGNRLLRVKLDGLRHRAYAFKGLWAVPGRRCLHISRAPLLTKATADSVPLQSPTAAAAPTASTSTGNSSASGSDAVYIKAPIAPGTVLEHPNCSVVVLGDVPLGAAIRAGGDVIVMGTLAGEAAAGCTGDASSIVLVGRVAGSAYLSIAGRPAPAALQAAGRDSQLLLALEPGEAGPCYQAMPGSPPLVAPAAPQPLLPRLARAAGALAVLSFGLALVLGPGQVLGGLLSTNAETIAGAMLDVFVFGYIILQGAALLAAGSELLLEIVNPGIIGGVVLPVLGALPDSLIILSSLSASQAEAQESLAVGVGTLAGSSVLLLSLAWGLSVLLGRCDLNEQGIAVDKKLTRGWDLARTGVTVDRDVRQGAAIMAGSVLLYGTVQVPAFMGFPNSPQAALVGAVACLSSMVGYCVYSVLSPQLQQRRIDAARRKRFRMVAVQALALRSSERYGSLVDWRGRLDPVTVRSIFDEFDTDHSGAIDKGEVQGLLLGLQLAGGSTEVPDQDTMDYWMKEFDANYDGRISFDEFNSALGRWVDEKLTSVESSAGGGNGFAGRYSALLDPHGGGPAASLLEDLPPDDLAALQETAAELEAESAADAADELEGQPAQPLSRKDILVRAVAQMGAGIALCAVFSDPLVDALTHLSRASGIAPFIVGFVLTPLASNSSELVSSLTFAARKKRKNMSLTLSQVYGAVTMNNTLVLGLFLVVVHLRKLAWVYSSEVAVIVAATLAVGALGASRSSFRAGWALPALALYPLSLGGVYLLDALLGWQ
ncbi:hypothetical protein OEZ86_001279 [Tetradesmus obliquus]|nr:hypothetical protein OEZ86_001279 [Tetradesmus obliquus]